MRHGRTSRMRARCSRCRICECIRECAGAGASVRTKGEWGGGMRARSHAPSGEYSFANARDARACSACPGAPLRHPVRHLRLIPVAPAPAPSAIDVEHSHAAATRQQDHKVQRLRRSGHETGDCSLHNGARGARGRRRTCAAASPSGAAAAQPSPSRTSSTSRGTSNPAPERLSTPAPPWVRARITRRPRGGGTGGTQAASHRAARGEQDVECAGDARPARRGGAARACAHVLRAPHARTHTHMRTIQHSHTHSHAMQFDM